MRFHDQKSPHLERGSNAETELLECHDITVAHIRRYIVSSSETLKQRTLLLNHFPPRTLLSRGLEHWFLNLHADEADAVVVAGEGAAYGEQRLGLAAGAAPGGVAYGFAVAAQERFGKI